MTTHYGRQAKEILVTSSVGDMDDGEQRNVDHYACPAGEDTRQRLYVKFVDGAYLFHCHNCGDSGHYRPREHISKIKENTKEITSHDLSLYHSLTCERDYDKFRVEGQLWLSRYGFGRDECLKYGIKESSEGIVLPIYCSTSLLPETLGAQVRCYNTGKPGPKYKTYSNYNFSYLKFSTLKPLVITEDLLSSYKVNNAGFPSLCLLGTKLNTNDIAFILKDHPRTVLWLDDDTAGHAATIKLFRQLQPLTNLSSFMHKQPKEIPIEILKTLEI